MYDSAVQFTLIRLEYVNKVLKRIAAMQKQRLLAECGQLQLLGEILFLRFFAAEAESIIIETAFSHGYYVSFIFEY